MSGVVEVVEVETTDVVVSDGAVAEVSRGSATVQYVPSGWALVTYSTGGEIPMSYSVSVSPDGLIRLPHSVTPEAAEAFCGAVAAAAEVGLRMQAETPPPRPGSGLANSPNLVSYRNNIVVTAGVPPAGAVRLPSSSAPTKMGR